MTAPRDDSAADSLGGAEPAPGLHAPAQDHYALPPDAEYSDRSLLDDAEALFVDGKTYLQAEYAYQKSRFAFVADRAKSAVVYGAIGSAFGFLALIGLTVGLIIALTPLLTAWGASAVVVGLLILAALIAFRAASKRFAALMDALGEDSGATDE